MLNSCAHTGMASQAKMARVRVGDRVRAHFRNAYGKQSSTTDMGTLLQFTTGEAEVHFDDGAVQCVPKTWITECLSNWDLVLSTGSLVLSHYSSGKGRTSGTDLGIVLSVWDNGKIRVRFQDEVVQSIPMGWVDEVIRLQTGDRVMSHYRCGDKELKSGKGDLGTVLNTSLDEARIVFDGGADQKVPKLWILQCVQPWDLKFEVGSMAEVHFEVGEERQRSIGTDLCIIVARDLEGHISVQFQDGIKQKIPMGWIVRVRNWAVGDRVQSHFKTGGGERSQGTDLATVLSLSTLDAELYFDDGIVQYVSKAWVTDRVSDWQARMPDLAVGDVVTAHFKRPGNQCRSVQTDQGIVMAVLPRGQISINFQDGVAQAIPRGWVETVAMRWSGHHKTRLREADTEQPPPERHDCDECVICMDAVANAVIVHGETCHQSTCLACAKKLQQNGGTCPICREPIDTVCKSHCE
uniref:RING-type domain-containing protein n=1 Tax=Noctiluca scintillans TaxID=2966 RepID=A0A7S1AFJ6_NOCSC|mmetsp:Transcript_44323/g.117560  ORF Transcript_44323/g.117560 Transcript_44323/m.117560 type:complete len:465 (+) Transcript_44323:119-1513(+)|eukprot:CAMPEP_0194512066 /NCGR_PEP_ID=MMETSP0253-20130528/43921_1 /TAXON_ID=2966 /ORGANISM="Noctiluca scintillans" /LENGTH=464 /DNA_ID=CAMNT_0039355467 /DNA_START=64 /DNA_END=1458 /DNA_ORIENTATION=+